MIITNARKLISETEHHFFFKLQKDKTLGSEGYVLAKKSFSGESSLENRN